MHRVFNVFTENEWGEWTLAVIFKNQKDAAKFVRTWYEKDKTHRNARIEVWEVN